MPGQNYPRTPHRRCIESTRKPTDGCVHLKYKLQNEWNWVWSRVKLKRFGLRAKTAIFWWFDLFLFLFQSKMKIRATRTSTHVYLFRINVIVVVVLYSIPILSRFVQHTKQVFFYHLRSVSLFLYTSHHIILNAYTFWRREKITAQNREKTKLLYSMRDTKSHTTFRIHSSRMLWIYKNTRLSVSIATPCSVVWKMENIWSAAR